MRKKSFLLDLYLNGIQIFEDVIVKESKKSVCLCLRREGFLIVPEQGFGLSEKAKRKHPGRVRRSECLVGPAGFEPTDGGVKVLCLTAWRRPIVKKTAQH